MGGIANGFAPTPQHDSWAGAIWGGTKDAASAVGRAAKEVVTGHADFPKIDGTGTEPVKIDRGTSLRVMGNQISNAYDRHTFCLREPEKFKQMQEDVEKFRQGAGMMGGGFGSPPAGIPREQGEMFQQMRELGAQKNQEQVEMSRQMGELGGTTPH